MADGTVFIESSGDRRTSDGQPVGGSTDRGVLYAIDASTGEALWSFEQGGRERGEFEKPAVADGTICVPHDDYPTDDSTINRTQYALSATDGSIQWSAEDYGLKLRVVGETVYSMIPATLEARSLADGSVQWSVDLADTGGGFTPPVVVDGRVYVGSVGTVYAFSDAQSTLTQTATGDQGGPSGGDESDGVGGTSTGESSPGQGDVDRQSGEQEVTGVSADSDETGGLSVFNRMEDETGLRAEFIAIGGVVVTLGLGMYRWLQAKVGE